MGNVKTNLGSVIRDDKIQHTNPKVYRNSERCLAETKQNTKTGKYC